VPFVAGAAQLESFTPFPTRAAVPRRSRSPPVRLSSSTRVPSYTAPSLEPNLNVFKFRAAATKIPKVSGRQQWFTMAALALLHPLLLFVLYSKLGEASNLVVFLGPVVASLLFSWRVGLLLVPVNVVTTALVFVRLQPPGSEDPARYMKAATSAIVVSCLCWVADRVRQVFEQRKRLTEELAQAKKMEAIGRLAGGVAHDMNNTLNVIMGSVFAHRQELVLYGRSFKDLELIAAACDRGAQLTQTLLGFARKGKLAHQVFSLSRIAQETELVLKRTTNKNIEIRAKLSTAEPFVEGDRGQLENAVMNLCLNGIDAMGATGTLTLETGGDASQSYLKVADTGVGMVPEVQARAFEPFFTTKEEGKGTGLGLSMVYSAVQSMNGKIELESRPGKGTEFTLIFPARTPVVNGDRSSTIVGPYAHESAPPSYDPDILRGLTILIVDDEPMVLRAGVRMLTAMGCRVYSAPRGRVAIETFAEHGSAIQLVIVDLLMPEMDGIQTIDALHKINAHVPVLLVSGCVADAARLAPFDAKRNLAAFLPKPYAAEQLCRAAQPLLATRTPRLQPLDSAV
jgi:signal transduction histidine kinase/CheY-like chemotaxis protein